MTDFTVWNTRQAALIGHLDMLQSTVDTYIEEGDLPRKQVINLLLHQLRKFASGYFDFFYKGFDPDREASPNPLVKSEQFQPDYVMRQVVDRLAIDIQVLERIIVERLLPNYDDTLLRADELAKAALEPAKALGLVHPLTTAITYFQKTAAIRVVPYAPVALVGIPMSSVIERQDLLAIPHEIGHYVYWNGQYNGTRIHKALDTYKQGKSRWLQNWLEEMFADVYGAMVSGALGAYGIQHVENESSKDQFLADDLEHPTPFVRPFIYNRVLQYRFWATPPDNDRDNELAALLVDEANGAPQLKQLIDNWQSILDNRAPEKTFLVLHPEAGRDVPLEISDIKKEMLKTVDDMLKAAGPFGTLFYDWLRDAAGGNKAAWPTALHNDIPIAEVVDTALAAFEALEGQIIKSQGVPAFDDATWTNWVAAYNIPQGNVPYSKWIELLRSEAWTTEGPHSRDRDD